MRITQITGANIKGNTFTEELSGRDLFVGPNGSGKTTRLETIMIGIQGCVPTRGKTLGDTYGLSSGDEMSVGLSTDSGFSCTRTIKEKVSKRRLTGEKTHTLTASTSVHPPRSEKSEAQKKDRIVAELGDFPLMFDLNEFFNMSEDKKRAFIFGLTDPGQFGWDKARIMSDIREEISDEKTLKELDAIWDDSSSVQDNMAFMIDWAKEQMSEAKAQLKAANSSKQKLLEQKQSLGASPRPRQQIKEEIEKIRANISEMTAAIAANNEKKRLLEELKRERVMLEEAEQEELPGPKDMDALTAELEKHNKQVADAKERVVRLRDKRSELSSKLTELRTEKKGLQQRLDSITQSLGTCPLSGKECPSFDDLEKFREELIGQIDGLSGSMDAQAKLIEETDALGLEAATSQKETEAKRDATQTEIANERVLVEKRKAAEKRKETLKANSKRIAEMAIEDTSMQEAAISGQKAKVSELETELEGNQEVHDLDKAFDRANLESVDLEDRIELLEDLGILLGTGRLQGAILKDTVAPIIDKVNALLQKTHESYNLKLDLYDKNGRPIFDLKWERGEASIPFESLSGGERCVFSVALSCALVLAENPPVKVLCLEASEVDQKNLDMLLVAVDDFGSDIDNIAVATHITPTEAPNWSVHTLG